MNISKSKVEETTTTSSNNGSYPVYTGVEAFHVVAVNPSMQELNDLGIPATEEPEYLGTQEMDGVEVPYAAIRVFLDNKDESRPIKTSVTYRIYDAEWIGRNSGKKEAINAYGKTAWVEVGPSGELVVSEKLESWFVQDGLKPTKRGEADVIALIRALYNLSEVSKDTPADERKDNVSFFVESDYKKFFAGDFSGLKDVLLAEEDAKVAFLVGVRKTDDGTLRQNLYSRNPLRAYHKARTENLGWLAKRVKESQENGQYSTTLFNLDDLELQHADVSKLETTPSDLDDMPF